MRNACESRSSIEVDIENMDIERIEILLYIFGVFYIFKDCIYHAH